VYLRNRQYLAAHARVAVTFKIIYALPAIGTGPGLLNFGDATSPGTGFLIGFTTQDETIARSSTLSSLRLMTDAA
jgi:hypothetical protein